MHFRTNIFLYELKCTTSFSQTWFRTFCQCICYFWWIGVVVTYGGFFETCVWIDHFEHIFVSKQPNFWVIQCTSHWMIPTNLVASAYSFRKGSKCEECWLRRDGGHVQDRTELCCIQPFTPSWTVGCLLLLSYTILCAWATWTMDTAPHPMAKSEYPCVVWAGSGCIYTADMRQIYLLLAGLASFPKLCDKSKTSTSIHLK